MSCISKKFAGFCPTQQKEYSVLVEYYGDGILEEKETFSRSRFDCSYQKSYGCPQANKCPIMAKAPYNMT